MLFVFSSSFPTLTAAVVFSQQVEKLQGEREIAYLMTI